MGKPFSPERLENLRRMKKARRLNKRQPLFAFLLMSGEYTDYTYEQFLDDLRYRRPPKKRKGKSGLVRFGRYRRMESLIVEYQLNGNIETAIKAKQLRERMTKPYRVQFRVKGEVMEYQLSALIPIEQIEKFVAELADCKSSVQANELFDRFNINSHIL